VGRVPASDTSDLTETTVRLTGKTSDTPAGDDTFTTVTTSDTEHVDHLVRSEDTVNGDSLLEQVLGEVNLGSNVTTVDLDLHDVGLLLAKLDLLDLGVGDEANNGAVVLDALELGLDVVVAFLGVLLGVLGESLSLGLEPVLVEATADFVTQVLSPHGGKRAEASGGFHIADNTDSHHRRGLDNSHTLHGLLLVEVGAGTFDITEDVSHASLVAHEGGEVAFL